jgi:4-hydroxybenzoate polyprenyltransferase
MIRVLIESLRLHQWAKNLLIFVPLLIGGKIHSVEAWTACVVGFVALGILTSSTYLINDFCDLPFDRHHWSKRERPLARGALPLNVVLVVAPVGALLGLAIAASIGGAAVLMLLAYGVSTLAYSFYLKRVPILDVFMLAALMTFRLCFGILLADVRPSPWLLVFSMFIFMSLAVAKRLVEVRRNGALGRMSISGRGYVDKDGPVLLGLGLSTTAGAVLIMILYLINEAFGATFYRSPLLLWALPAILFLWLSRIWLLVGRDELDDDPLRFAVRDSISLILGAAMVAVFVSAWRL